MKFVLKRKKNYNLDQSFWTIRTYTLFWSQKQQSTNPYTHLTLIMEYNRRNVKFNTVHSGGRNT